MPIYINEYKEMMEEACPYNEDAAEFLVKIGKIYRTWDDVWDGDKPYTKEQIDDCFSDALFGFNANSFYRKYSDILSSHIFIAWNAWSDANEMVKSDREIEVKCAWFLRDMCLEIIYVCAFLTNGKEHARAISRKFRPIFLERLAAGG